MAPKHAIAHFMWWIENSALYGSRKTTPEYRYINYDLKTVNKDYERIDAEIAAMQIALDKYNQTFEFEVEV